MARIIFFTSLITLLFQGVIFPSYSQKPVSEKITLQGNESINNAGSDLFLFPNVNTVPYYYNKNELEKIEKSISQKNWDNLYPALDAYVRKFGIENFDRNNILLWYLAQLTENKGDTVEARNLYRLVLKHYREGLDLKQVQLKINEIEDLKKEDYVPLNYYYELVEYRKSVDTLRPPRGVLLNMGTSINSGDNDYGPTLSASNEILLFTSKRNKIKRGLEKSDNEDLFLSKNQSGYWGDAEPLTGVNSPYNEGSACLSPDHQTLFFVRCNSPDSYGSCDIFVSTLQSDSTWGTPKNLGAKVNSPSWDSHPALSHSGDTLYFASDRLGGFGLSDIYFTHKTGSGEWSAPKNLGPVINTRNSEVSPFYHPAHNVLYFSSEGQLLNFGEFDIYKSYRHGNLWGEPLNIGPLVNGQGSEFYFTIDAQSKNLYYARSEENKMSNLDLFSFPLPMEAQPTATTVLRGSIRDEDTGEPFSKGIISIIDLDNGIEVAPKFLRPDGSFAFQLINNNNYLIIIQGEEFFRLEEIFYLDGDTEFHRKTASISSKIKFESLNFDNGKAELKPEMFGDLDKVIDFLLDNPEFKLKIEGHTDTDGNPAANLKLSQLRADAIKEYIIGFGNIDPTRVEAIGHGSNKPIVEEKTDQDKKLNRRVEFNIYK